MNEVKKIHLGRQPFTIAVDAHRLLRSYLEAIEHQVGARSEVIKEVESRMAELLMERGIQGDKVVLEEDVEFLKEQLGDPGDFKDDDHEAEPEDSQAQKRLYRDPQNAMLAGVCSGLAAYLGVDVTIVRLLFVLALFFGGASILVYLVLWLVMPEAKTPSERLQMQGKAVTVDSLKQLVDRADVKSAADRASRTAGPIFERLLQVLSAIVGWFLVLTAVAAFMTLTVVTTYVLFHRHDLIAQTISFPLGTSETVFASMIGVVVAIGSLLALFVGMAMIRRKWLVPGWITAALIGLMLIASSVGAAFGPDAVTSVHDRYRAAHHTSISTTGPFNAVVIAGKDVTFMYEQSDSYGVGVEYIGHRAPSSLKTSIDKGVLTVDASSVGGQFCRGVCVAMSDSKVVVIRAPRLDSITSDNGMTLVPYIVSGVHYRTFDPDNTN